MDLNEKVTGNRTIEVAGFNLNFTWSREQGKTPLEISAQGPKQDPVNKDVPNAPVATIASANIKVMLVTGKPQIQYLDGLTIAEISDLLTKLVSQAREIEADIKATLPATA